MAGRNVFVALSVVAGLSRDPQPGAIRDHAEIRGSLYQTLSAQILTPRSLAVKNTTRAL